MQRGSGSAGDDNSAPWLPDPWSPEMTPQPPPRRTFDQLGGDLDDQPHSSLQITSSSPRPRHQPRRVLQKQTGDTVASKAKKKGPTNKHSKDDIAYDGLADERDQDSMQQEIEADQIADDEHLARLMQDQSWPQEMELEETGPRAGDARPAAAGTADADERLARRLQDLEVDRVREEAEFPPSDPGAQHRRLIAAASFGPHSLRAFNLALAEGEQPVGSVKLCFVGHARAGKTSTLLSLAGRPFDAEQPSTQGVQTCCALANELLHAPDPSAAWDVLCGPGSVGDLMRQDVARTVARTLTDACVCRAEEDDSAPPLLDTQEAFAPSIGEAAVALRMPVDLIAQAVSGDSGQPERSVVMQTWDFAGQEMYYHMAHVFLTSLGLYCLVLDLSAWACEEDARSPFSELVQSLDFWLAAIFVHAREAQLVIVGTHIDAISQELRPSVCARVGEHLQQRLDRMPSLHARLHVNEPDQLLFFPVDNSRATAEGRRSVEVLRTTLNELAVGMADSLGNIPTRWAHFFHVLSRERPQGSSGPGQCGGSSSTAVAQGPCMTVAECEALARPLGLVREKNELEAFLTLFHGLGHLLHFPGSPAVVLDPQWLLDAMAHVVGCPRVLRGHSHLAAAFRERGELSAELLTLLWRDERFQGHGPTLKAFLEHFDLLVPAPDERHARWLVPSLLPLRRAPGLPSASGACAPQQGVAFVFDFHGALQMMLPSLIPRLLCQLRRQEGRKLRVFTVQRDSVRFSLGAPPLMVTMDMFPATAPQVVCVDASALVGRIVDAPALRALSEAVREALQVWLPNISFSTKLPCPACRSAACGGAGASAGAGAGALEAAGLRAESRAERGAERLAALGHLLDLSDVLQDEILYCDVQHVPFDEEVLPAPVREWRRAELGPSAPARPRPAAEDALGAEGRARAGCPGGPTVQLNFLYASPLGHHQLDVAAEVQALRSIGNVRTEVRAGTVDALRETLISRSANAVLHISAHCALRPVPALIMEDECSGLHALTEEMLAQIGPWNTVNLFVFLGCGSEILVRRLFRRCGEFPAICCTAPVFDAAARVFCKTFYHSLGAGHAVAACHAYAQAAVRSSADSGMQKEADKFVCLGPEFVPSAGSADWFELDAGEACVPWPMWPRVEDYICRGSMTCEVAATLCKRRVVLVSGHAGMGKSAFCVEFCRHFSAPGRLFSTGAWILSGSQFRRRETQRILNGGDAFRDAFAQLVLAKVVVKGPGPACVGANPDDGNKPWDALLTTTRQLDKLGRWLLVFDGLEAAEASVDELEARDEALANALGDLLGSCARLCLLLTSRGGPRGRWASLGSSKVVGLEVAPLPLRDAALLFARRVQRPLFAYDFRPGPVGEASEAEPVRVLGAVLDQLAASPLLVALGGVPGQVVEAAAVVDNSLPSLRSHPLLEAKFTD